MTYVIEMIDCPEPHRVLREAAVSLPGLAAALAPREVELPDGKREVIQPGTVELPGARVHVIPLQREMRADGTITPPAAVVIVDGERAEEVGERIDAALWRQARAVDAAAYEVPGGARVVLAGAAIAETGAAARKASAERLARLAAVVAALDEGDARELGSSAMQSPTP